VLYDQLDGGAAIGAGQEGDADIEINGSPDIEIWCDEVGIGAHAYRETDYEIKLYPEQPDDPKIVWVVWRCKGQDKRRSQD